MRDKSTEISENTRLNSLKPLQENSSGIRKLVVVWLLPRRPIALGMLLTAGGACRLRWRRRREEIKRKEKLDLGNEMRENNKEYGEGKYSSVGEWVG
jgi:hypothetical protein